MSAKLPQGPSDREDGYTQFCAEPVWLWYTKVVLSIAVLPLTFGLAVIGAAAYWISLVFIPDQD